MRPKPPPMASPAAISIQRPKLGLARNSVVRIAIAMPVMP
jgi:hypothetical protein